MTSDHLHRRGGLLPKNRGSSVKCSRDVKHFFMSHSVVMMIEFFVLTWPTISLFCSVGILSVRYTYSSRYRAHITTEILESLRRQ